METISSVSLQIGAEVKNDLPGNFYSHLCIFSTPTAKINRLCVLSETDFKTKQAVVNPSFLFAHLDRSYCKKRCLCPIMNDKFSNHKTILLL